MSDPLSDPLLLGQRVVAVLETGLRTATYKLASLMALIDHCIEHLPDNPRDTLLVPIPDLAHRVLEIYWRQVRPFEGQELRQSTQPRARILIAASTFRSSAGCNASLEVAIVRAPAKSPSVSPSSPCIGSSDYPNPIDHVLPWSVVGIDGLANLVLACARCNGDKRNSLPAVDIVDRVLARDRQVLEQIAAELEWPTQRERVIAAARGLYRGQPSGVPTWSGYHQVASLDISYPPWWIQITP
jgi:5-methylcytosine-specific restriction endonuclease McrA